MDSLLLLLFQSKLQYLESIMDIQATDEKFNRCWCFRSGK